MSFTYEAHEVNSAEAPYFRHFLALYSTMLAPDSRRTFQDQFTILSSAPEETYIAETGVGFHPEAIFFVAQTADGVAENNHFYFGAAARSSQWGIRLFHPYLNHAFFRKSAFSNREILYEIGELNSFNSDGFTFNLPNPIGETLVVTYFAMRGGGGYACGSAQCPTANGLQAITGLGFTPAAILFASAQTESIGETTDFARFTVGFGDDQGSEYSIWGGSGSGDVHVNQIAQSGKVLAMTEDSSILTPYNPVIQAAASIDSFDPSGFTLDWIETDGTSRWFGWIAFQNAEVGRFLYSHVANNEQATITTSHAPDGLVFIANQQGTEALTQYVPSTESVGNAIGFCDEALNQKVCGYYDGSRPPFGFPQTTSNCDGTDSFGSFERKVGLPAPDFLSNRGEIIEFEGVFNPIVGMNMRYADRDSSASRLLVNQDGLS